MSKSQLSRRRQDTYDEIDDDIPLSLESQVDSDQQQLAEQRAVHSKHSRISDAEHAEDFQLALKEFRNVSKKSSDKENIGSHLSTALSWNDVLLIADSAVEVYMRKAQNGLSGFSRRFGREFGRNASSVKAALKAVPKCSYTEPLLGVFDFIIDAAALLHERSQQIGNSLHELPDTLDLVARARENYPSDRELTMTIRKLYTAILTAVESMIIYLEKPPEKKFFKATAKGDTFEQTLVENLEKIKSCYKQVSALATALDRELGVRTNKTVHGLERGMAAGRHKLDHMMTKMDRLSEELRAQFESFIRETIRKSEWAGYRKALAMGPPPRKQAITTEDLERILAIEPTLAVREVELILRNETTGADLSQGLFLGIPHEKRFKDWLSTRESELIFLQDNMASLERSRISPMSVFCAGLARSLRNEHAVISIQFFCGRHDLLEDNCPSLGPAGLMRSLIYQLIRTSGYASFDLDFLKPSRARSSIAKGDVPTLCWVFGSLVRQLPPDTVLFCFVDGLSFFEVAAYRDKTREVMQCLQGIVQDEELPSIFKLMVTHLSSNGHRKYYINPGDCLLLSRQAEFEGYDLTEREIAARMRRARVYEEPPIEEEDDFSESGEDEDECWNGDLLQD